MSASTSSDHAASYSADPQLRRAFRRGWDAGSGGEAIPGYIIDGCRDVHVAWLDGYMCGVPLSDQ